MYKSALTDSDLPSKGVHFLPWVGEKYGTETGRRLLILGESHYGIEGAKNPQLTRECIAEHSRREWNHRFFTMLTRLVSGKNHWEVDRSAFWEGLAFYNYIQRSVAATPGIAPTAEDFIKGEGPFRTIVEGLTPTHILICSRRLWNNLPRPLFDSKLTSASETTGEIWSMNTKFPTLAMWIPHPSRAECQTVGSAVANFLSTHHPVVVQ